MRDLALVVRSTKIALGCASGEVYTVTTRYVLTLLQCFLLAVRKYQHNLGEKSVKRQNEENKARHMFKAKKIYRWTLLSLLRDALLKIWSLCGW